MTAFKIPYRGAVLQVAPLLGRVVADEAVGAALRHPELAVAPTGAERVLGHGVGVEGGRGGRGGRRADVVAAHGATLETVVVVLAVNRQLNGFFEGVRLHSVGVAEPALALKIGYEEVARCAFLESGR